LPNGWAQDDRRIHTTGPTIGTATIRRMHMICPIKKAAHHVVRIPVAIIGTDAHVNIAIA